eukprot:3500531-Rhodomonas_salina.1
MVFNVGTCPAGYYGQLSSGCTKCPMDGSRVEGVNTGVLSCTCPAGYVLSHRWADNQHRNECVNASGLGGCEDVYDFVHQRCWKILDGRRDWFEAEAACQSWMSGGHLASFQENSEYFEVLVPLILHHGPHRICEYEGWFWIGTSAQIDHRQYQNPDGTKRTIKASRFADNNYWGLAMWSKFCLTIHGDGAGPIPTECKTSWTRDGRPIWEQKHIMGSLCATRPAVCQPGQYGYFPNCQPCPGGGSSTAGLNFGVYSCQCKEGKALTYNALDSLAVECRVSDPIMIIQERMDLEVCDGIYDWATRRCWKYIANIVPDVIVNSWDGLGQNISTWQAAETACTAWGRHLASMHGPSELALASRLTKDFGNFGQDLVWFGHNALGPDGWGWVDGSPFTFLSWAGNQLSSNVGACCGLFWTEEGDNNWQVQAELRDFPCEYPAQIVRGAICATTPNWMCPDGTYGTICDANTFEESCKPCPGGSTSIEGFNYELNRAFAHTAPRSLPGLLNACPLKTATACWWKRQRSASKS